MLNKVLTYDILRITRGDAASAEYDAVACFDRIIPALVVVAYIRLGLERQAGELFLDSLTGMQHQLKTAHGTSQAYTSTRDHKHFGTGQGSGGSPAAWNFIDEVLLNTMDKQGMGLNLNNPTDTVRHQRNEDVFVDDANLVVNREEPQCSIQRKSQQHEQTLYATGGKLALHKCTWVMLQWAWTEGVAHLKTYEADEEGKITTTSPHKLEVRDSVTEEVHTISQLHPSTGYRTLGVHIAADGNEKTQKKVLHKKVKEWTRHVNNSALTANEIQLAYSSCLKPQISYPFPCVKISKEELRKIFRPALNTLLHTINLNEHFPLALVHGSADYFGLQLDDVYFLRGISQLKFLLGHLNMKDRTGDLIRIAHEHMELTLGHGVSPLEQPSIA